ncbi:MAG TPA: TetR/AcrR family transcriptional regulator [Polyangia bacterium]
MARPADPNAKIDLLRAAEAVFAERGLDNAKVEEITERAGHSKGSFYLHFSSKEDAFRQIVESTLARLATCLDVGEIDESVRLPPAEHVARWRAHDLEMFEFIWANRRVMRLMLEGGGSSEFGYLIDQFADRSRRQAAAALQLGVEAGLYRRDLDVEIAAMVLAGGYDRFARELVRAERKPDLPTLLATLQRICLTGIASQRVASVIDPTVNKPLRRNIAKPARIKVPVTRSRAR